MPQGLADLLLRGRLRAVLARLRGEASACQEPAWQCRQLCTTALVMFRMFHTPAKLRAANSLKAMAPYADALEDRQATS